MFVLFNMVFLVFIRVIGSSSEFFFSWGRVLKVGEYFFYVLLWVGWKFIVVSFF